ncbi:hypothetical protein ES692_00600 [Psychroserpens burtonensis]|uniref:Uncharacterized protein n=1 Tax=Psychroserpens burtonensis TaxID=49278 RepID=A0A5C7BJL7_9FLAO|nr:hypothetical protein [Psychroserpens burtonensis]TXE20322.1 hypothetical protein ES692_00600 [Psychroserpens burtonensis]
MKNLKLVVLIALALNLVTVSCSSDDDNNVTPSDNVMTIEGEQISIETAVLVGYGENDNGSFDWDVSLLSEGFVITISEPENTTGNGSSIFLELSTNSASGLVPGTYTFANESSAFKLVSAQASTNLNAETGDGNYFIATSGTVTITGTGTNQVIKVNLVGENGNNITASYSGLLQTV